MNTNPTTITADDLTEIPLGSGQKYGPPPTAVLPPELRQVREQLLAARDAWTAADRDRAAAEHVAGNADRDYHTAQHAAALAGEDPLAVVDDRGQKQAAAVAAIERASATRAAVTTRWTELVRGVIDHRDTILATIAPELDAAQADAVAALAAFTEARHRLDRAIGLHVWCNGLKPRGVVDGLNTAQGPKGETPNVEITWLDRRGSAHRMLASTLMPAVEVYARGADNLRAVEEREHAEALRQAGDRKAQEAPVPSGKLTV